MRAEHFTLLHNFATLSPCRDIHTMHALRCMGWHEQDNGRDIEKE